MKKCVICNKKIVIDNKYSRNVKYCSDPCRKQGKKNTEKRFHKKNPKRRIDYEMRRNKKFGKDTLKGRFFRKYPNIKQECIICGEVRVIDLHHIIPREGVPTRMSNTTPQTVVVLCPNHHALIERLNYTLEELRNG